MCLFYQYFFRVGEREREGREKREEGGSIFLEHTKIIVRSCQISRYQVGIPHPLLGTRPVRGNPLCGGLSGWPILDSLEREMNRTKK